MATIPLTVTGATAPYNISVKKQGDNTERFVSYNGTILTFNSTNETSSVTYTIYLTDANQCPAQKIFNLVCGGGIKPSFTAELIQPRCDVNNVFQNAILKIRNAQNVTRYKTCFNSTTFDPSCNTNCTDSTGFINSPSQDITIPSPPQGSTQNVTIRFYNGESCNDYYDYSFKLNSPRCDDITLAVLDFVVNQSSLGATCDNFNTYSKEYDIYVTPNATGLESINGQQARSAGGINRNIPNREVPDVYISAPFKASCGVPGTSGSSITSIFYRFAFNFSLLRANFPTVNEYKFDVYANVTKGTGTNLSVTRVSFKGIAMAKLLHSNDSVDAYRDPFEKQPSGSIPNGVGTYAGTGVQKIGTFVYNYSLNTITWTPS